MTSQFFLILSTTPASSIFKILWLKSSNSSESFCIPMLTKIQTCSLMSRGTRLFHCGLGEKGLWFMKYSRVFSSVTAL